MEWFEFTTENMVVYINAKDIVTARNLFDSRYTHGLVTSIRSDKSLDFMVREQGFTINDFKPFGKAQEKRKDSVDYYIDAVVANPAVPCNNNNNKCGICFIGIDNRTTRAD